MSEQGPVKPASGRTPKKARLTGARLGTRGIVAQAMLEDGASLSKVRKATGISETTASFLRKNKILPRAQVDAVKRHLQDRFALVAHEALEAINAGKLQDAGFGELVRGAAVAADRAGLQQPSVMEQYFAVIQKYQTPATPEPPTPTVIPTTAEATDESTGEAHGETVTD